MNLLEIWLVALGVSADAFAVSVSEGLKHKKAASQALKISVIFGVFQAGMPLLGWFLGKNFVAYIDTWDHWLVFFLLTYLGIESLYSGYRKTKENPTAYREELPSGITQLLVLGVATSLDALAVGISFSLLAVNIIWAVAIIGTTTFLLSILGVYAGSRLKGHFEATAEIVGGIILIILAFKILLSHLQ